MSGTVEAVEAAGESRPERGAAPRSAGDARAIAVLALLVVLASWLSLTLTRVEGGVAFLWIANGLLVGFALLAPRSRWPWLFAASAGAMIVVRIAAGDPLLEAFGLTAANLLECGVVAGSIRHAVPDIRDPARLPALARVAIASTIAAAATSGLVSAVLLHWTQGARLDAIWWTWFAAHLLGMVIVATMTVTAIRLGRGAFGRPGRRRDLAMSVGYLVLAFAVVFWRRDLPLLFLAYLPFVLLAYRHGFPGVLLGSGVLAVGAAVAAAWHLGTFDMVADLADRALLMQVFVGAGCLLAYPIAVGQAERRRLAHQVRVSEGEYRLLAEHARDLIVRMDTSGRVLYVSPSVEVLLGWAPAQFREAPWEWIHPDDRVRVRNQFGNLFRYGGSLVATYRVLHRDGHYVWIEASVHRVDSIDPPEVLFAGRAADERVAMEEALLESQQQLQGVADHVPALIARFDADERYVFANAALGRHLGEDPDALIGKSLREARGDGLYVEFEPHVRAALAGESRSFEWQRTEAAGTVDYRTDFTPSRGPSGAVNGFYAVTVDVSQIKQAERRFEQLAHEDALTGLANRRQFEQSVEHACLRAQRTGSPLMLLAMDLDRFKAINDTHGHGAGDVVLQAVAARIRACVYDVDVPARLGGDEFVVLVDYAPTQDVGIAIAERLLAAMREPIVVDDTPLTVGISIGIGVHFPARSREQLLALADAALYEAKEAGRNTWRVQAG
jgi:diguanylate cyclase (GGDEF)-like protein/PAS domain S-box-containing protein